MSRFLDWHRASKVLRNRMGLGGDGNPYTANDEGVYRGAAPKDLLLQFDSTHLCSYRHTPHAPPRLQL